MSISLRMRWALWASLATGVAVILVAISLYFAVGGLLQRSQIEKAISNSSAVQERLESLIQRQRGNPFDPSLGQIQIDAHDLDALAYADRHMHGIELRLVAPNGNSLQEVSSGNFPKGIPNNLELGEYSLKDQILIVRPMRSLNAVLTVATDAAVLSDLRHAFLRALWLLPLGLLMSLLGGWLVAGQLLKPIQVLEKTARDIGSSGDLRRSIPGASTSDELSRLALALQDSFAHVADAREREQTFLRAAAHDLRSPLTAIQARVGGTLSKERSATHYRDELKEIDHDISRLTNLANHLLLLARNPEAMFHSAISLRQLAAEAVDNARELAPEVDIDLDAPSEIVITGDRVLLGQAIWNLASNAVKYAPASAITISVTLAEKYAIVSVSDEGSGVPKEIVGRLGEAFFRPSSSRSGDGHGLGLAIARRAAELHGGTLELKNSAKGGFIAEIKLPVQML